MIRYREKASARRRYVYELRHSGSLNVITVITPHATSRGYSHYTTQYTTIVDESFIDFAQLGTSTDHNTSTVLLENNSKFQGRQSRVIT